MTDCKVTKYYLITSLFFRNEDSRYTKSEESFLSLHVKVMKTLETSKEISKTFNVMKMCHVQKTTKTVAKKRNHRKSNLPLVQ